MYLGNRMHLGYRLQEQTFCIKVINLVCELICDRYCDGELSHTVSTHACKLVVSLGD